jgi:hypothetical protein
MTRDEKISALLDLLTCPHCDEIRERDRTYNGVKICFNCQSRAWAGYPTLKSLKEKA